MILLIPFCIGPSSSADAEGGYEVPRFLLWGPAHAEWGCVGMGVTSVTVTFVPDHDIAAGGFTVPAGSVPDSVETFGTWTVTKTGDAYTVTSPPIWGGMGTRAGSFIATYPVDTGEGTVGVSVQWLIGITDLERLIVN